MHKCRNWEIYTRIYCKADKSSCGWPCNTHNAGLRLKIIHIYIAILSPQKWSNSKDQIFIFHRSNSCLMSIKISFPNWYVIVRDIVILLLVFNGCISKNINGLVTHMFLIWAHLIVKKILSEIGLVDTKEYNMLIKCSKLKEKNLYSILININSFGCHYE